MKLKDNRKITELSVSEFVDLITNAVDKEYSIEEAADYLGCGKTKIYELVNASELKKIHRRGCKQSFIMKSQLDSYILKSKKE